MGLKLYEEVVNTTGIGYKLTVTEVALSNFEETTKNNCLLSQWAPILNWGYLFNQSSVWIAYQRTDNWEILI